MTLRKGISSAGLGGLVLLATAAGGAAASTNITTTTAGTSQKSQTQAAEDTAQAVRKKLERLPYFGVFDWLAYGVDRGRVRLVGYSFRPSLKSDATMAVKQASGVDEVVNDIEVLPVSIEDDRIRWATFYRIYADDFLSRYAPGGVPEVLRELRDERRFPGMQPVGVYPIHIIVKNGRTLLLGVVDSPLDRQLAEVRAREVPGVFNVENSLIVNNKKGTL
jgi:hyperosmotically inducible periplasmic protein